MSRRAVAGSLTAAATAAVIGLGQPGPGHAHGPAVLRVHEAAVTLPVPPGGPGGSGVAPPTISNVPGGGQVVSYTDANGNVYSFRIGASQMTQDEVNVWDKLQQGLGRAGQFSNGGNNGTGYEYLPVLRDSGSTPDLLRLQWDNGQLVGVTRVDIYSPGATTNNNTIYDTLNNVKQGTQADEVVIDLEGRDKDSIMNVIENIGQSMKSDNEVDFQKLDGVRIIADAQTYAPPTVDATVVRAAGTATDPVPLGLGGVTVTGDAAAADAQGAITSAAATQLPPEELPPYETPEE